MSKPALVGLPIAGQADEGYYAKIRCPECGSIGWIDRDQFEGKISIECTEKVCTYHETHDLRVDGEST